MSVTTKRVLRTAGAMVVLAATFYWIDAESVFRRLSNLDLAWVALGILLSLANYVFLAMRWRLVARRLGAPLSFGLALADYCLAGFANQALPTGLAGAALRAIRHGKRTVEDGSRVGIGLALSIVVLERIAGLAVLAIAALCGSIAIGATQPLLAGIAAAAMLGLSLVAFGVFSLAARRSAAGASEFSRKARSALIAERTWLQHLFLSGFSTVLLCVAFYCAARASDVDVSLGRALVVTPIVLASMVIPLAIGGWGIREGAAAVLFSALGLDAASGVAVSVTFGLIALVASLPGALVWLVPGGDSTSAPL